MPLCCAGVVDSYTPSAHGRGDVILAVAPGQLRVFATPLATPDSLTDVAGSQGSGEPNFPARPGVREEPSRCAHGVVTVLPGVSRTRSVAARWKRAGTCQGNVLASAVEAKEVLGSLSLLRA